jgi:putative endonuclease
VGKTQERGRWAEDLAARHLRGHGLKELQRNYLCRGGEIDIIMQEATTLVFIEVRYRRSGLYGGARETLGATKKARLLRAAGHYLLSHRGIDLPCRFDLVAVEGEPDAPRIEWIKAAFDA